MKRLLASIFAVTLLFSSPAGSFTDENCWMDAAYWDTSYFDAAYYDAGCEGSSGGIDAEGKGRTMFGLGLGLQN